MWMVTCSTLVFSSKFRGRFMGALIRAVAFLQTRIFLKKVCIVSCKITKKIFILMSNDYGALLIIIFGKKFFLEL